MSAAQAITLVGGVTGAGVITAVTTSWWTRRGKDVATSTRAVAAATATTALLIPALMLTSAGIYAAQWWLFVIPAAWLATGVTGVLEQRQARSRDITLGAPRRPMLWSPWLVGASTFVILNVAMMCTLMLWVLLEGDIGTPEVAAVGSSATCGTFLMTGAQYLRRARARGGAEIFEEVERSPQRGLLAVAAGCLGLAAVVAGTLWSSTLPFGTSDAHLIAMLLSSVPGWVLIGLSWMLARPQAPVIAGGL